MSNNILHIISFNIPYPPNYGGVIDVFYKIKALKESGYEIILHTFLYDREPDEKLNQLCKQVYYYERKTGLLSFLHYLPYIVYSRRSSELIENLSKDSYPVIFEGLHTCYYLNSKNLSSRNRIVRTHNIEHQYYYQLYKAERNIFKKLFFLTEAMKLRLYQNILKNATSLAAISNDDYSYFKTINNNTFHLHPFHSNSEISARTGKGKYYIYHANLEVPENHKAIVFLINEVFTSPDYKLIIAGKNPKNELKALISGKSNILLTENPSESEMQNLIFDAHAIVLFTYQSTGIKLKLLESLFKGRFCIVNDNIVKGTELEKVCIVANTSADLKSQIKEIDKLTFSKDMKTQRRQLIENYLPKNNIIALIRKLNRGI